MAVLRQHPPNTRGICRWCGAAVAETTETGKLRWWHDACETEYLIIMRPDMARRAVFQRDHGICTDCGEDWSDRCRFVPTYRDSDTREARVCYAQARPSQHAPSGYFFATQGYPEDGWHLFVEITAISLWHVDHKVPLWKVAHLPDLQRLEYFKLPNLITRCERCHGHKTGKEAGERAHLDELAGENKPKVKRAWPQGRKLQSRGFAPGHRPMNRKRKSENVRKS